VGVRVDAGVAVSITTAGVSVGVGSDEVTTEVPQAMAPSVSATVAKSGVKLRRAGIFCPASILDYAALSS
jgi:hypothetical protein